MIADTEIRVVRNSALYITFKMWVKDADELMTIRSFGDTLLLEHDLSDYSQRS